MDVSGSKVVSPVLDKLYQEEQDTDLSLEARPLEILEASDKSIEHLLLIRTHK